MIELLGGPLDGTCLRMPIVTPEPGAEIPYGLVEADALVEFEATRRAHERLGEPLPDDAEPETEWQGVYRWLEHVATFDGRNFDRFVWRDG